jgi:class 3 adenylate cyclase
MQIWERAIIRSLVSHLLRRPELRQQVRDEQVEEIEQSYARLLDDFRRPRSVYSEVRDIINQRHTGHQLSTYLDDPLWDDLEDLLGEVIGQCKPIYLYLDAVDEEFSHAPMYWLKCQEGLFYQVMRLLRDHRLGGRLHIVVCIRDIVMSSVYRSEHAPRYYNEPHIRVLTWDRNSLLYLLHQKLRRLPPSLLMRRPADGVPTVRDWLGVDGQWPGPDGDGAIEDYLLSHTRLIPRDIISLGNELNEEVLRQKQAGHDGLPPTALRAMVQRCAKRFGDSQLAQCANQVSSDLMPKNAALHDYSELFTSTQAYIRGVQEDVRSFVRMIGVDRFPRADLVALQEMADLHFEQATDLASVLWQNGLLGYMDENGHRRFYSMGDIEEFHFPPEVDTYVLHPCLVYAVGGIRRVPPGPAGPGRTRRISLPTSGPGDAISAGGALKSRLPSGTVTLLFTDVEGSTRLWDAERDAMAEALRYHDEIVRGAIERAGGYVFKTVGDAFCAAFEAARAGLDAALDAQRELAEQAWPTSRPIVVRMGLHAGVCEERDGDYFGPAVNRAARLLAVASGGQVLVSGVAAELLSDELPEGVGLRELGTRQLKDLTRPERIYEVEAAFPAAPAAGRPAVGHTTGENGRPR